MKALTAEARERQGASADDGEEISTGAAADEDEAMAWMGGLSGLSGDGALARSIGDAFASLARTLHDAGQSLQDAGKTTARRCAPRRSNELLRGQRKRERRKLAH